jgi:hypothetical protein
MTWDVNIIDFLSFITTVVLTLYVVIFLEKKQGNRRAEKDLVIAEINLLIELLRGLNSSIQSGERTHTAIVSKLKDIKSHFLRTTHLITLCSITVKRDLVLSNSAKLKILDHLLTYTPPTRMLHLTSAIVSISNGQIVYSSAGLIEISRCCNDSVTLMHNLQVIVNRN